MILTTQTDYIGRTFGDLAAVDILADAGFDALDYTMFGMREDDCLLNTDAYKAHITALQKQPSVRKAVFDRHVYFASLKNFEEYSALQMIGQTTTLVSSS